MLLRPATKLPSGSGVVPLMSPMTLLQHYLREYPNPYLASQVYLNPHPEDLALRYSL